MLKESHQIECSLHAYSSPVILVARTAGLGTNCLGNRPASYRIRPRGQFDKAGNSKVRTTMIELAWSWLRYQTLDSRRLIYASGGHGSRQENFLSFWAANQGP
jgi:hypothetical protein